MLAENLPCSQAWNWGEWQFLWRPEDLVVPGPPSAPLASRCCRSASGSPVKRENWLCPLQKEGAAGLGLPEALAPAEGRAVRRSENRQSRAGQPISCGLGAGSLPDHTRMGAQSGANACSHCRQSPNPYSTDQTWAPGSTPHGPGDKAFKSLKLAFSNSRGRL